MRALRSLLAGLGRTLGGALLGVLAAAAAGLVFYVDRMPELSVWHTAALDEEFTADSPVASFEEYLALEERLFAQLEDRVFARIAPDERTRIDRFHRGSLSDPGRWPRDWNRSYAWPVDAPRAAAVLVHGMSDSPYALHNQAERLHAAGVYVVGLRVPGHGTAPVALTRVRYEDMAAALRLAVQHARERVPDRPLFLVGFSNGGALSLHYTLGAIADGARPRPDALVLFSPEIAVTPAAALAVWQDRIGRLLGWPKLAWSSLGPEYDPFKYVSFAVNAGDQAHRITGELARLVAEAAAAGRLEAVPPVLVFQSAVDSTVSTPAVIQGLLARLPPRGHELVLFDLNRMADVDELLAYDPRDDLVALLDRGDLPFTLRVVTNESPQSPRVALYSRAPGTRERRRIDLALEWPPQVFSLSHVAVQFPPQDPLYGDGSGAPSPGIALGRIALRGEHGVLRVAPADMLRARSNPFYPYVETRMLEFLGLAEATGPAAASAPARADEQVDRGP